MEPQKIIWTTLGVARKIRKGSPIRARSAVSYGLTNTNPRMGFSRIVLALRARLLLLGGLQRIHS